MNRYIHKGAKGIGLVDYSGDTPKMKYVFDISDTSERYNSRAVNVWKCNPDAENDVIEALDSFYGIDRTENLDEKYKNARTATGLSLIIYLFFSELFSIMIKSLRKLSVGSCKAEIFKSQRLIGFSAKYKTYSVCSCGIIQSYIKRLKLIKAAGISDNTAAEQFSVGGFFMYFHRAGLIVSVCNGEFKGSISRHIKDIRE